MTRNANNSGDVIGIGTEMEILTERISSRIWICLKEISTSTLNIFLSFFVSATETALKTDCVVCKMSPRKKQILNGYVVWRIWSWNDIWTSELDLENEIWMSRSDLGDLETSTSIAKIASLTFSSFDRLNSDVAFSLEEIWTFFGFP